MGTHECGFPFSLYRRLFLIHIEIPENVKFIIEKLENAGFEAYVVGGCVRDSLLNRTPNDWDITTSAKPEQTKAIFKKTFDTGIKHGTISILLGDDIYEVTTYRIDGEYEDSRHPKEVTFTANLQEDLLRRDFTINAMAYNPTRGLADLYGGVEDLEKKVIRCVGNPYDRFSEDALRIMRAIRFAAQLDYSIEEQTRKAIVELAPTLSKISAERIQTEFVKMMVSPHPEYIQMAYELGLTKVIMPEYDAIVECFQNNPHHMSTVGDHTLRVLRNTPSDKILRLAALFHDFGKPSTKHVGKDGIDHFYGHPAVSAKIAQGIFKRLKFDTDTQTKVCHLSKMHDWTIGADSSKMRTYINRIGEEYFPMIFELSKADILGQSEFRKEEKLSKLSELEAEYKRIMEHGECVSMKTLAVSGRDVIAAGVPAGPAVGKVLDALLQEVLDDPSKNNKEYLLSRIDSLGE